MLIQVSIQVVEARVCITQMVDELCDWKIEFNSKERDLMLELSSANDQITKLTQLLEERVGKI